MRQGPAEMAGQSPAGSLPQFPGALGPISGAGNGTGRNGNGNGLCEESGRRSEMEITSHNYCKLLHVDIHTIFLDNFPSSCCFLGTDVCFLDRIVEYINICRP